MLSLIGLIGGGSIPLIVFCFGSLLTLIALWAIDFLITRSNLKRKEKHMRTEKAQVTEFLVVTSMLKTAWTIGTGVVSGLALSG